MPHQIVHAAVFAVLLSCQLWAEPFEIVAWNLESGGNHPPLVADLIEEYAGIDIWVLSEVHARNKRRYAVAAGRGEGAFFNPVMSESGGGDRLLVIYNSEMFEELSHFELSHLRFGGGRSPLVLKLRLLSTDDKFFLVANHFHRRSATKRNRQADGLRQWAEGQEIPVITAGDFNMDFDLPNGPGNTAFRKLLSGGTFHWLRPEELVTTQYSDSDEDGENDHNSVLDFFFLTESAMPWALESQIVVEEGDFPDDDTTSDHRPVYASFDTDGGRSPDRAAPFAALHLPFRNVGEMERAVRHGQSDLNVEWPSTDAHLLRNDRFRKQPQEKIEDRLSAIEEQLSELRELMERLKRE